MSPESESSGQSQREQAEAILDSVPQNATLKDTEEAIEKLVNLITDINDVIDLVPRIKKLNKKHKALKKGEVPPDDTEDAETTATDKQKQEEKQKEQPQESEAISKTKSVLNEYYQEIAGARTYRDLVNFHEPVTSDKESRMKVQRVARFYSQRLNNVQSVLGGLADVVYKVRSDEVGEAHQLIKKVQDLQLELNALGERLEKNIDTPLDELKRQFLTQDADDEQSTEQGEPAVIELIQKLKTLIQAMAENNRTAMYSFYSEVLRTYANESGWVKQLVDSFEDTHDSIVKNPWAKNPIDFSSLSRNNNELGELFKNALELFQQEQQSIYLERLDRSLSIVQASTIYELRKKIDAVKTQLPQAVTEAYMEAVNTAIYLATASAEKFDLAQLAGDIKHLRLGVDFKSKILRLAAAEAEAQEARRVSEKVNEEIALAAGLDEAIAVLKKYENHHRYSDYIMAIEHIKALFQGIGHSIFVKNEPLSASEIKPPGTDAQWKLIDSYAIRNVLEKKFLTWAKDRLEEWKVEVAKEKIKLREQIESTLGEVLDTILASNIDATGSFENLVPQSQLETMRQNLKEKYQSKIVLELAAQNILAMPLASLQMWHNTLGKLRESTLMVIAHSQTLPSFSYGLARTFKELYSDVASVHRSVDFMNMRKMRNGTMEFLAINRPLEDIKAEATQRVEAVIITRLMAQQHQHEAFEERSRIAESYHLEHPAYVATPTNLNSRNPEIANEEDWNTLTQTAINRVVEVWGFDREQVVKASKEVRLPATQESLVRLIEHILPQENSKLVFAPDSFFHGSSDQPSHQGRLRPDPGYERHILAGRDGNYQWRESSREEKQTAIRETVDNTTLEFNLAPTKIKNSLDVYAKDAGRFFPDHHLRIRLNDLLTNEMVQSVIEKMGDKDTYAIKQELVTLAHNSSELYNKQQEVNTFFTEVIELALKDPGEFVRGVCKHPTGEGLSPMDWYQVLFSVVEGYSGDLTHRVATNSLSKTLTAEHLENARMAGRARQVTTDNK